MVLAAKIGNAVRLFGNNPNALRWVPKTGAKNATVAFEKRFLTGINGEKVYCGIDKVVTRADGQVIRGHYTTDGLLTGVTQLSNAGRIETSFGAQNYDKIVNITTNAGETITRLTHKNRPQSFLDTFHSNGIYGQGDYTADYNRLRAEVQNAPQHPKWLQDIVNKWRQG